MVTLTTDFGWRTGRKRRGYRNLKGSSPSYFNGDELPVEKVSWFDAVTYRNALSTKERLTACYQNQWGDSGMGRRGEVYREHAHQRKRSGNTQRTQRRRPERYAGSLTVDGVAWIDTEPGNSMHAVKTKTANGLGLYDLSGKRGNGSGRHLSGRTMKLTPPTDPLGSIDRREPGVPWRLVERRAGMSARVARRIDNAPTIRFSGVGFRIVRSYP